MTPTQPPQGVMAPAEALEMLDLAAIVLRSFDRPVQAGGVVEARATFAALLARCEGLEAALRNARDYVEGELSQQRVTFRGYERCSDISSIEADLTQIDNLLAATRTTGDGT